MHETMLESVRAERKRLQGEKRAQSRFDERRRGSHDATALQATSRDEIASLETYLCLRLAVAVAVGLDRQVPTEKEHPLLESLLYEEPISAEICQDQRHSDPALLGFYRYVFWALELKWAATLTLTLTSTLAPESVTTAHPTLLFS